MPFSVSENRSKENSLQEKVEMKRKIRSKNQEEQKEAKEQ